MRQRYLRMADQKRVPDKRVTRILLKEEDLSRKLKCFQKNMLIWETWQAS